MPQTIFKQDSLAEKKIHMYLEKYMYLPYLNDVKNCKYEPTPEDSKEKQFAGIDVILRRYSEIGNIETTYIIDEKAAITACNSRLPTFSQELCYLSKNDSKKYKIGWLLDDEKKTTHYLFSYIALTDKKNSEYKKCPSNHDKSSLIENIDIEKDIQEIECILVSRQKIRCFLASEIKKEIEKLTEFKSNKKTCLTKADLDLINSRKSENEAELLKVNIIKNKSIAKKAIHQHIKKMQKVNAYTENVSNKMIVPLEKYIYTDEQKNKKTIRYTVGHKSNQKKAPITYTKSLDLAEQPICIPLKKEILINLAHDGHYYISKEYGIQKGPQYYDFENGDWIKHS